MVINKNVLHSKNRRVNEKTKLLLVISYQYYEEIIFDII